MASNHSRSRNPISQHSKDNRLNNRSNEARRPRPPSRSRRSRERIQSHERIRSRSPNRSARPNHGGPIRSHPIRSPPKTIWPSEGRWENERRRSRSPRPSRQIHQDIPGRTDVSKDQHFGGRNAGERYSPPQSYRKDQDRRAEMRFSPSEIRKNYDLERLQQERPGRPHSNEERYRKARSPLRGNEDIHQHNYLNDPHWTSGNIYAAEKSPDITNAYFQPDDRSNFGPSDVRLDVARGSLDIRNVTYEMDQRQRLPPRQFLSGGEMSEIIPPERDTWKRFESPAKVLRRDEVDFPRNIMDSRTYDQQPMIEAVKERYDGRSDYHRDYPNMTVCREVPFFDGTDPDFIAHQFIYAIYAIGRREGWNADEKKFQFVSKLAGPAKEWYAVAGKTKSSWKTLKKSFIQHFPSEMDFAEILTLMLKRKKIGTESYEQYFSHKVPLIQQCNLTDRQTVSCLIDGIENEGLKLIVKRHNFANASKLLAFLEDNDRKLFAKRESEMSDYPKERDAASYTPIKSQALPPSTDKRVTAIRINGSLFEGYNDMRSRVLTIQEDHAIKARLNYNHVGSLVRGYMGILVNALGSTNVSVRIGSAVFNVDAYVVPNVVQNVPVIIGESVRLHKSVQFLLDKNGTAHFSRRPEENSPPREMSYRR